jgi:hypothetical protein
MKNVLLAVVGLAVGLGLGLWYSRVLSPVEFINTAPRELRAEYQTAFIQLVARAYDVDGDLGRAQTRLALLGLADPIRSVTALAQRSAAEEAGTDTVRTLAALAAALGGGPATPTPVAATAVDPTAPTPATATGAAPSPTSPVTRAPPTETVIPSITPRLLATRTPTALPPGAFDFVGRQLVCDPALGQPLIQVLAEDAVGAGVPGVEVVITWPGGFDHFYTGLKPDVGRGYGDFTMSLGIDYSLHLAESPANIIEGLTTENCVAPSGDAYPGSWLLVFRQP